MEEKFRINQDELAYIHQNAQARMRYNPDIAAKYKKIIDEYPFYQSEKEALQSTIDIINKEYSNYQIWAKIGKDDEYYYIQDYYIATDDNIIKQTAEYIGMILIYDGTRLQTIIDNNRR